MRCDQCKHWKPDDTEDWAAEEIGFRLCTAVRPRWKIQDEASELKIEGDAAELRAEALRAARAYVQDGSEYLADLVTGPDFFCALFQQK